MRNRRPDWVRLCLIVANLGLPIVTFAAFSTPGKWWAIGSESIAHLLMLYAFVSPSCNWLGPVATRFVTDEKQVWLTIDDGPDGENSVRLAQDMESRGVRATFFVKGRNLSGQPGVAGQLLASGHTLANHTHTHPVHIFWWLFPERLRREIDSCNRAIQEAGAGTTEWFRAPAGLKHIFLHGILAKRGMRLIGWSLRAHDGIIHHPKRIIRRVASRIQPGDILLMHEGRELSNSTVLQVIDDLRRRGYVFVIPSDEQLV